ncbi:MAG: ABC transporter ATP-binding protein [Ruminococcaceae bacterium]|nr:ABC transporter ATP-binding protein [Oscillospiraceae bacterium]
MKRWMKYVSPYKKYFIMGPLCMIIEVIGEMFMPIFLAEIINRANRGTLTVGSSIGIAALMILTALIMMAGGVGGSYFGTKASVNFAADLRNDVYEKVQTFSFSSIDKFSTGSLVTRLTNDVTQMQNMVNMMLRMMLRSPGMLIGGIIMAIRLKPSLSLVLAVSIPILLISVGLLVYNGFSRFSRMQTKIDDLNNTVKEDITNIRVVKSFVREDHEEEKFKKANGELKDAGMNAMKIMIFMSPVMTIIMNLTTLAVIWFGGRIVLSGGMEPGDLSAFITYVTQILSSLMMVTMMFMMSSRALASAKRVGEVLDETTDLNDLYAAHPEKEVEEGTVEFKNVTYRYNKTSEEPVLDKVNVRIPAGATVGIIGSTGAGKTTLVSMIPRLYDPDEGQVLVDGVDVKDYSLYNLREGIGMVLQKNVLFSGSIAENLRWGDHDATDEEIRTVAQYAQADKFVTSFKDGYEHMLDQGGTNVSGGQKQRLCIARTLLKKPKILILDDSTSAVDTATEAQIRRAFREELSGSTKIIIAQRISSVMEADFIIVMDDGCITGVGSHNELLAGNTEYQEIYYSQMEKKEAK